MWFPLSPHSDSDYALSDAFGTKLSVGTRVDRMCLFTYTTLHVLHRRLKDKPNWGKRD